jgi:hypothetical protein
MDYYCAFEAMNLNNLFADCHDLSATRGGGLAVLKIGDRVARELDTTPISSSASQGLIRVKGESAEAVETRVREILGGLDLLEHATVAVAACEAGEGDDGQFQRRIATLKTRMRWEQMRAPSVVYPTLSGKRVCSFDRVRPATHDNPDPKDETRPYLSAFTYERRRFGRDQKRSLLERILNLSGKRLQIISDLNELSDAARESLGNAAGKIAVLRFDGNDFGKKAEACKTEGDLAAFSRARQEEQERFIRELVLSDEGAWIKDGKIRLEVLVYGGDEVTIVTPAWLGWKALRAFYSQHFESGITYSAGVVFCHSNAPIHSIKKLASELTDQAKDRAKPRNHNEKGDFAAYQVLESFDSIGRRLPEWMEERYPASAGGPNRAILGRDEICCIDKNMGHWRSAFSKRKLYELADAIRDNDRSWLDLDLAGVLKNLLESKGSAPEAVRDGIEKLYSAAGIMAFLHILELWDYVGGEQ